MTRRPKIGPGVDFRVDETWMVETLGSVLLRHAVERDAASGGATLALTYGVGKRAPFAFIPERWKDRAPDPAPVYSPPPPYEFELTVRSTLLPGSSRIDRLGDAGRIESDTQRIVFAPDFRTAQSEHRAEVARSLPLSTTTPD
jgi:hypothetical protein